MPQLRHACAITLTFAFVFSFCAIGKAQMETRFDTPFIRNTGNDDGAVAVADFNHDGKLDVALVSQDLQIFLGKGDGTFQAPINYVVGDNPGSIALADFNGDGQLDIALTNYLSSTVSILFGNSDGTFQPPTTFGVSTFSAFITAGDFNGDGKPDFAVITLTAINVYLNNGDGTFAPPKSTLIGQRAQLNGFAVGDFNRDGILDAAVSNNTGDGALVILLGNGDGSFTQAENYNDFVGGVGPIAVGDFRGNGMLDLAVAPYLNSLVNIYLGNGDGSFQPAVGYSSPWGKSVVVADFNGDGKQDVVLPNPQNLPAPFGNVVLLLGNGDGTLQAPDLFPVGNSGSYLDYVAVGDLNGDGMPDVVNVDRSGDMFTLLNTGAAHFIPTSPVTFPAQLIGTTGTPMAAQMTNAGTVPIKISSVTASGTPFKITNNACTGTLAPGAQCKIGVSFTPTRKNSATGTLSIVDSASSKPQVVELSGPGTFVKLVPSSLKFPTTKVGTTSAPQTIQLTNTQAAPLNITSTIYVAGGLNKDYPESNNCGKQLAAGASCTITISFSPQKTGVRNAYLYIQDDGGGAPQEPKITGTGD